MRYILYLLSVVLAYSVALHAEQQKWFSHEVCKTLVDIGKQYDVLEAADDNGDVFKVDVSTLTQTVNSPLSIASTLGDIQLGDNFLL